jgi:hypothetical protein
MGSTLYGNSRFVIMSYSVNCSVNNGATSQEARTALFVLWLNWHACGFHTKVLLAYTGHAKNMQ